MDDPLSDPRIRLPVSATLNFKTISYFTKSCSLCDEPVHVIHTVFLPAAGTEISTIHRTSLDVNIVIKYPILPNPVSPNPISPNPKYVGQTKIGPIWRTYSMYAVEETKNVSRDYATFDDLSMQL
jgi:hypothetical protein